MAESSLEAPYRTWACVQLRVVPAVAMTGHAEAVLQALELPYRVVLLCTGASSVITDEGR